MRIIAVMSVICLGQECGDGIRVDVGYPTRIQRPWCYHVTGRRGSSLINLALANDVVFYKRMSDRRYADNLYSDAILLCYEIAVLGSAIARS
jgi:hypothetical protein